MNIQVKTSDGRLYDATVNPNATISDLLSTIFHPHPVPRNASLMARTRLLDPRERVQNVMHHDLFLVGPKPEAVRSQHEKLQQQQQQQQQHHHQNTNQQYHTSNSSYGNNHHQQQPQQNRYGGGGNGNIPVGPDNYFNNQQQQQQRSPQQQQHRTNPYNLNTSSSSNNNNNNNNHHSSTRRGHQNSSSSSSSTMNPQTLHEQYNHPPHHFHNAKEAVDHLQQFVASPSSGQTSSTQPQFQQQNNNQNNSSHHQQNTHNDSNISANGAGGTSPTPRSVNVKQLPKDPKQLLDAIRSFYTEYSAKIKDPETSKKEKQMLGEESMKLLFKLDELMDLDPELKPEKKQLVKDIQSMQDEIDGRAH